jgi:methionyl-tRNA synthetase
METSAPTPTPADAQPAGKPTVSFEEFAKLDLRVARIVTIEPHPNADKLFKIQVDDGSGTPRQICAGIREYYKPEDLLGQRIVIVANLAPRIIRGEESRGMLLAASSAPKDAPAGTRSVVIITPYTDIAPGAIVS